MTGRAPRNWLIRSRPTNCTARWIVEPVLGPAKPDPGAAQCCPVSDEFGQCYHWSLMQVEYATDLAFRSTTTLSPLYEQLIRETVLSVKAEQIATFLGRQITPLLAQEIGSQFSTRIESLPRT